jgi:hypothetical protein
MWLQNRGERGDHWTKVNKLFLAEPRSIQMVSRCSQHKIHQMHDTQQAAVKQLCKQQVSWQASPTLAW